MNKINTLVDEYKYQVNNVQQESLKDISNLEHLINLSSQYLHLIRLSVRDKGFPTDAHEIHFFKELKPFINGHLKYYSNVHYYLMNRPRLSLSKQRKYIHLLLEKFEAIKARELDFVNYYRHKGTKFDHIYFIRGQNTIATTNNLNHFIDIEFSTSHDDYVAKIIAYDLLIIYYQQELRSLKNQKFTPIIEAPPPLQKYLWTASKTDLVEIMYAIHALGAVQNGNIDIKSLATICETLFDIDLGNFYKTYGEIKAREKDRTKFLDNLKNSLIRKMDKDDSN
ncbi:RteC domain-containing protein [Bizionia arctica]|uniref:Tetracycline regulation of excision, RteC n=1 Tax=Bizionia arctica TaxID=1495645 RepID=A0A917GMY0_9FLAO|nr:RteC domain-containing protein [Bizionia arctica]GGG51574.1 hypothetical protein GCM10010976_23430 [Bizionia arctica]